MAYQVTARKWRPMVFEDVVGQSHVTETLKNAIATNRVAHAFIFGGSRGCGKTTTARILAKAVNCLSPKNANPDNACEICEDITAGRSLDVIEIDGASNRGIEEIRNLRDAVRFAPTRGKYKVYIIDEVHMLTAPAFNALLKTLEEPPPHVIFIFATTEVHKVPATILSRCQRFDFRRIPIEEIAERLRFIAKEENITVDEESLLILARKGEGSMRDAQSFFDQVRSFCGNTIVAKDVLKTLNVVDQEVYFRITDLIRTKDRKSGISFVNELFQGGVDLREFVIGLTEHFRHLLVVRTTGSTELVEASDHYRKRYQENAKQFSENDLLRLLKMTYELEPAMRYSPQPRFRLEVGLLQMIAMEGSVEVEQVLRDLELLKKKVIGAEPAGGAGTVPSRGPAESSNSAVTGTPPADVRLVGTVSAGRLQQRGPAPERPLTIERPTRAPLVSSAASATLETAAPGPVVRPAMKTISADEAYARWQEWVGEVSRERISVGTILGDSRLEDVRDGSVTIACPDDYHLASIKRNREFLAASFRSMTGCSIQIEPVLRPANGGHGPRPNAPEKTSQGQSKAGPTASPEAIEDHPVIRALRREFGAERVE